MEKNRAYFIISIGVVNVLHGFIHLFQFIQSLFLVGISTDILIKYRMVMHVIHSPFFNLIIALIGLTSLWIGYIDFKHHKICKEVSN